jgi:hypothetical protein
MYCPSFPEAPTMQIFILYVPLLPRAQETDARTSIAATQLMGWSPSLDHAGRKEEDDDRE